MIIKKPLYRIKMWYWYDGSEWCCVSEFVDIEKEYTDHLLGTRVGQRVYHCFGDGSTACINFDTMTTYCGSGRCMLSHKSKGISDDHMTFKLKRK